MVCFRNVLGHFLTTLMLLKMNLMWITEGADGRPALAGLTLWPSLRPVVLPHLGAFPFPGGGPQASFRVLMGKEGIVTIVTGLSTV